MESSTTKYYSSWAGYSIPMKPKGEISQGEAEKRVSYYIGVFENEKLVRFTKVLHGERIWTDIYSYWEDGKTIKLREMEKKDGSRILQEFDQSGKPISK